MSQFDPTTAAGQSAIASDYALISPAPTNLMEAAATINQEQIYIPIVVSITSVSAYLAISGKYQSFLSWAKSPPAGASSGSLLAAAMLLDAFSNTGIFPYFDMTNQSVYDKMSEWLSDLVSPGTGIVGPIDAADQSAILSLSQNLVNKWTSTVTPFMIFVALGRPSNINTLTWEIS